LERSITPEDESGVVGSEIGLDVDNGPLQFVKNREFIPINKKIRLHFLSLTGNSKAANDGLYIIGILIHFLKYNL
jgi:hypothetical protein